MSVVSKDMEKPAQSCRKRNPPSTGSLALSGSSSRSDAPVMTSSSSDTDISLRSGFVCSLCRKVAFEEFPHCMSATDVQQVEKSELFQGRKYRIGDLYCSAHLSKPESGPPVLKLDPLIKEDIFQAENRDVAANEEEDTQNHDE